MNSMVLISEETRGDLLGRRVSGGVDREARVSSGGRSGFRVGQAGDGVAGSGKGGMKTPSALEAANLEEMDRDSAELEGSDSSEDWRTWMHGFKIGDMVWGKVKSHPWWPGHIFSDAFASDSVRRTRREGHVLVAFFGDSSYGWFEPAELVPFDLHFAEKSKQTSSRNFLKSVEEAVDEVSRRRALGLSCCCRDPTSFRPTSVPGHVAVNVIGFEPNLVYSVKEIKRARDAFVPTEVIPNLRELALAPGEVEYGNIGLIKTMATLLALRRATYEEFDETYAQAFGVEPVRPSRDAQGVIDQAPNITPRAAPLSGPLVVAETLGRRRSVPARSSVVKASSRDRSRKADYLFKRRDDAAPAQPEPAEVAVRYIDFAQPDGGRAPPSQPPEVDDYVLQKRAPPEPPKREPAPEPEPAGSAPRKDEPAPPPEPDGDRDRDLTGAEIERKEEKPEGKPDLVAEVKEEVAVRVPSPPVAAEKESVDEEKPKIQSPEAQSRRIREAAVAGPALQKARKAARPDVAPDEAATVVERKKRKKMESEGLPGMEQVALKQARSSGDKETRRRFAGAGQPSAAPPAAPAREAGDRASSAGSFSPILLPRIELTLQDLDFPLLVTDLSALALDPFYGMERNASLLVRHVFLRFRSLVYQKSLSPPASESELETRSAKRGGMAAPAQATSAGPLQGDAREQQEPASAVKPSKQQLQRAAMGRDDQASIGRKRPLSDRQEEMSAKREKKLKQLKVLASEKKAAISQKAPMDVQKENDAKAALAAKIPKPEKKPEPAPKVPSPTYLVMKFPPGTTLPSISSQKVKFGRFGPLDISGFRVYWKSHTCKMLFKFRTDAQSAYMHAVNNNMFGQIKVNYSLRDVEVPAPEPAESSDKQPVEARPDDVQSTRPSQNDESSVDPRLAALRQLQQQQQGGQLKSCLKKPPGDEAGPSGTSNVKETPRVKFALVVEGRQEPSAVVIGSDGNGDGRREPPAVSAGNSGIGDGRREPPVVSAGNGGNGDGRRESLVVAAEVGGGHGDGRRELPVVDGSGRHELPVVDGSGRRQPAATPGVGINGHNGNSIPISLPPPPLDSSYNISRPLNPVAPPPPRPLPPPPHVLARPQIRSPLPQFPPPPPPPQHIAVPRERVMPQLGRAQAHQVQTAERGELRNVDISRQMLNLLIKCSDVVKNVNSALGYAIYHPL